MKTGASTLNRLACLSAYARYRCETGVKELIGDITSTLLSILLVVSKETPPKNSLILHLVLDAAVDLKRSFHAHKHLGTGVGI